MAVLFGDLNSPTGIHGMYWQSHYGVAYGLTHDFDVGLRLNWAFTRFNAGDGTGFDNSLTLNTAYRF